MATKTELQGVENSSQKLRGRGPAAGSSFLLGVAMWNNDEKRLLSQQRLGPDREVSARSHVHVSFHGDLSGVSCHLRIQQKTPQQEGRT